MATSETWKDKNSGEKKTETEWHRIVFWGKQAEIIGEYLTKGRQIYVEGKMKTRKWTDQQNVDRYITEIHGSSFLMLGNRSDNGGGGGGYQQGAANQSNSPAGGNAYAGGGTNQYAGDSFPDMDDDIPF
jgi:single-strand DNA-binding protein